MRRVASQSSSWKDKYVDVAIAVVPNRKIDNYIILFFLATIRLNFKTRVEGKTWMDSDMYVQLQETPRRERKYMYNELERSRDQENET